MLLVLYEDKASGFDPSPIKHLTIMFFDEIGPNSIVLDAGCNKGFLGKELIRRGCIVYGVDVSLKAITLARYRGLIASVCPVEELTFRDNFFDYCLAFELLEHLYNPKEGLRQLYRVLKPSGKLFGSVPYPSGKFSKSSKYQWTLHQHDFNRESLKILLGMFFDTNKTKIEKKKFPSQVNMHKLFFRAIK